MSNVQPRGGLVIRTISNIAHALVAAVGRLDKSFSPTVTISRLRNYHFTLSDSIYLLHIGLGVFWLALMQDPPFPYKLAIPILYTIALLIPFTSQFFIPATPVFVWLITWYSSRFLPPSWRPSISVSLLPTLESVLYGANISDILTRFTHPVLDILAWFPYGVVHFTFPFVVAIFLWLFRSKKALHLWARTFGYMNLIGVVIQIILPCSAPWYELIYGLTPANYSMKGSPGGLARIDALFHSQAYTLGFTNSPLVFGAFPSLHAGNATLEALFLSHFFPHTTAFIWAYAGVLYWATMYLTHHYLIDVVGGACLATASFYLFVPDDLRGSHALSPPTNSPLNRVGRSKYDLYDLEDPRGATLMLSAQEFDDAISEPSSEEGEMDITYRSPLPSASQFPSPVHNAPLSGSSTTSTTKKGFPNGNNSSKGRGHHGHTASIASLIRGDERGPEDGWSPVAGNFTILPNGRGRAD